MVVKSCTHGPRILAELGRDGTIRHGDLADRLGISAPSLTQAIRALAGSGTLTSTVHGKFKYYSLTPLGRVVAGKSRQGGELSSAVEGMKAALRWLTACRLQEATKGHQSPRREFLGRHGPGLHVHESSDVLDALLAEFSPSLAQRRARGQASRQSRIGRPRKAKVVLTASRPWSRGARAAAK